MRFCGDQECVLCVVVTPLWIEECGNTDPQTFKDDDDDCDEDTDDDVMIMVMNIYFQRQCKRECDFLGETVSDFLRM